MVTVLQTKSIAKLNSLVYYITVSFMKLGIRYRKIGGASIRSMISEKGTLELPHTTGPTVQ